MPNLNSKAISAQNFKDTFISLPEQLLKKTYYANFSKFHRISKCTNKLSVMCFGQTNRNTKRIASFSTVFLHLCPQQPHLGGGVTVGSLKSHDFGSTNFTKTSASTQLWQSKGKCAATVYATTKTTFETNNFRAKTRTGFLIERACPFHTA